MSRRDCLLNGMQIGMLATLALASLSKDCMGKEDYLAYVGSHWVPAYISTPIAVGALFIAGLLLVCAVYMSAKRGAK